MEYTVKSDKLPIGVYLLSKLNNDFLLQRIDDFKLPKRMYGDTSTDRYLKSFKESDKSMGILFVGIKGGGKTLEAKKLCIDSKLPVIVVSQSFEGEAFQQFLATLQQEVVIFMDEFDKVYNEEQQEQLLPILDGVFSTKKLFILTSNSMNVSQYLKNRTGRIRYLKRFEGVEESVIREVVEDKLKNKEHQEELISLLELLSTVSMDNLVNLIDEMNRFDMPANQAIQSLNIQIEHIDFEVVFFVSGRRHVAKVHFNPLVSSYIYIPYKYIDDRGNTIYNSYHRPTEEMTLSIVDGEFHYEDIDGNTFIFTPIKPDNQNYLQMLENYN